MPSPRLGQSFQASIIDESHLRLVQNNTSKIILQAFLAVMVVGWVASFKMLRETGRVVTHNPCTAMGAFTLLAGSELVDSLPCERELDGKQLRKKYESVRFRLGWWPRDEKGTHLLSINEAPESALTSRFGIDVVDARKSR